jgi:molybdopterin molybdotransferase
MMKPFRSTISLDDALAIVRDAIVPIARTERVTIEAAHGRVLAATIAATADVPSFTRSAMDGYAVIAADTQGASRDHAVTLTLTGRLYAGDAADGSAAITSGVCMEIATGAPLPAGADAVVMVEDTSIGTPTPDASSTPNASAQGANTRKEGRVATHATHATHETHAQGTIDVFASVRAGQHVVRRAADMRQGDTVLHAGVTLEPSRIGALAAIGIAEVEVFAKPVVAILPTGNELVAPGQPLPPGHVYDMNRYTLGALVERHGGIARQLPTVIDTPEAVRNALEAIDGSNSDSRPSRAFVGTMDGAAVEMAAPVDLLIFCGGSSVGERDLVIDALREQGEVLFHGIAVKPGKPTAFARLGSTLVLGMPGNPTSCLSNAYVLMIPLLRALARLQPARPTVVRAPLSQRVTSPRDRLQFLPVRIEDGQATPTFKGSGEITSLSQADGYITIPLGEDVVEAGTPVDVTLY